MTRTAIATGASGGIGRGIAERLAKDGFSVVAHYAGNTAKAEELVNPQRGERDAAALVQRQR